ncbi:MAG: CopG family transcriptional regulator, partial [Methylocella sp.]
MKEQFTVYLEPDLMKALTEYAERRRKPKSLVAEAAIASFLSPDTAERQEAALARRLDRITRQMERLERDIGISVETVALFIRFWLMATPSLSEQTQASARAKGTERYEGFMQALGRRLAKGPSFIQEVSLDIPSPASTQTENNIE